MSKTAAPDLLTADKAITPREYELFRALVYEQTGINLGAQKQQLLRARLGKRLRAGRFKSYRAYYEFVKSDATGAELHALIDAISTNTTHLFREKQHFEFLRRTLRQCIDDPAWRASNRTLRIWSAGCSSGDEPYSIAMTVDDVLAGRHDWRILATDISARVLEQARAGCYDAHRLGTVPPQFRSRYFTRDRDPKRSTLQVRAELRERITFAQLNLMDARFPFRHGFHWIFCRNVMIYFDRPTQEALVRKLATHLRPGGYLVIGHSESLNGVHHGLQYVQPTIYRQTTT